MKTQSPLFAYATLLSLFLTIAPAKAQEREVVAVQVGVTVGGGSVQDRGGMEHVAFGGLSTSGATYYEDEGRGSSFTAGIAGSIAIDDRLRLGLSTRIEQRWTEYNLEEGGVAFLPSNEVKSIPRSFLRLRLNLLSLVGEVTASYRVLSVGDIDLHLLGGAYLETLLAGREERRVVENRAYNTDRDTLFPEIIPPLPAAVAWRSIEEKASVQFGLMGGLDVEIPLGKRLTLSPKILYHHTLTNLISGSNWRSYTVGGAVDLMWRL